MTMNLEEQRESVRRALDLGKKQGASAVHVNCGNVEKQTVTFASGRLKECSQASSEKFTVTLVIGGRRGMASGNDWNALPALVERAAIFARNGAVAHFEKYPSPAPSYQKVKTFSASVDALTPERIIDDCAEMVSALKKLDADLTIGAGGGVQHATSLTATDAGFWQEEQGTLWSLGAGYQKTTGTDMLFSGSGRSWRAHNEFYDPKGILSDLEFDLRHGSKTANASSGPVTLILPPELLEMFLTPLALALNGRNVCKGTSPLKGHLGEQRFASNFTVFDNPHIDFAPSSASADNCGVPTVARHLVKDGVPLCFLYDYDTAGMAKEAPTGNESFSPYTMLVQPGDASFEALLKTVKRGVYVKEFLGFGQSNMDNGDFSANLSLAFWVENGEITHRVKNAMVAGNLFELLRDGPQFSSNTHPWNQQPYAFFPNVSLKA